MINARAFSNGFCTRRTLFALALLACNSTGAFCASSITGTVRNESRGLPAAEDDVSLLRLDNGMREEARAKTDALGAFTLLVRYSEKPYLVRVIHQGVSYDQQAFAGDALTIRVFDAAPQVRGMTGSIEILRAGTNGKLLHVSDLYEVKNESSPPMTQAGERTFEVYLPAAAKIDSVLAAGPGKIGEVISATPVRGEAGHYAVNFPLPPGATKFAFNYDLPYAGHAAFRTRLAYPLQQLAVMIPPTMKFSSRSKAFEILATGNSRYQVRAASKLMAGEGPGFEVSGTGILPYLGDQSKSQTRSQYPTVPDLSFSAPGRASLPSSSSIKSRSERTQPPSQSRVLEGVTFLLLAACALLVWRARKVRNFSAAQAVALRERQRNRPPPDWKLQGTGAGTKSHRFRSTHGAL
jgi:hypothetical protein